MISLTKKQLAGLHQTVSASALALSLVACASSTINSRGLANISLREPVANRIYQVNDDLFIAAHSSEKKTVNWFTEGRSVPSTKELKNFETYYAAADYAADHQNCAQNEITLRQRLYTDPRAAKRICAFSLFEARKDDDSPNAIPVQYIPEEFKEYKDLPGYACISKKLFAALMFQTQLTTRPREYHAIDLQKSKTEVLKYVAVFLPDEKQSAPKIQIKVYSEGICQKQKCYQASYFGPLYDSCDSQCRMQGYSIVIDRQGRVLQFLSSSLVYKDAYEYLMDKSSIERLRLIANDKDLLKTIYEFAPDDNYSARMSHLSTDFEGGGNSVGTFLVHLARIRQAMSSELTSTALTNQERRPWPLYLGPSPGEKISRPN